MILTVAGEAIQEGASKPKLLPEEHSVYGTLTRWVLIEGTWISWESKLVLAIDSYDNEVCMWAKDAQPESNHGQ